MEIIQYGLFDGKVCYTCQQWRFLSEFQKNSKKKDGLSIWCRTCFNAYQKEVRKRTAERSPNYSSDYRKKWYQENKAEHDARVKRWHANNKERMQAHQKRYSGLYYEKNKERISQRSRAYARMHPEYGTICTRRYRVRKQGAIGKYTVSEWRKLCAQYDYRCLCCNERKKLTADHIVPISKGGGNSIDNIQPLCQSCNSRKGARTIDYRQPE